MEECFSISNVMVKLFFNPSLLSNFFLLTVVLAKLKFLLEVVDLGFVWVQKSNYSLMEKIEV